MATKPQPRATNLSTRRGGHPAIPVEQRETREVEQRQEQLPPQPDLTDDPQTRTAQVSARVTRARRAAFKAKLAQLGTTMDAEINKCIDEVLKRES
ncbi:hypothetical protein R3Q06_28930 [Rhodococcus erythropolis]|uniref:hypothetical protein n=1 Tax=Rhodococcus erythropolis TaxID=1833 RepID=UPI002948FFDE|nr:hypothetical protein [Rhodococcus erythropolis]MDV6277522.1 hypothetical protein [Rhodococcus erythropolis]